MFGLMYKPNDRGWKVRGSNLNISLYLIDIFNFYFSNILKYHYIDIYK